jgi:hypothetical protein
MDLVKAGDLAIVEVHRWTVVEVDEVSMIVFHHSQQVKLRLVDGDGIFRHHPGHNFIAI